MPPCDPWTELERRPHITFALAQLPPAVGGGFYARWPTGEAVVVVDAARRREEQTAILAHELVHDDRGGGCPCSSDDSPAWRVVVAREEARVARLAAALLVPLEELASYVDQVVDLEEPVTAYDVAEAFATTEGTAGTALEALLALRARARRELDAG
jgi:Zn-dependent peptidase ImmA (M78 family)